MDDLAHGLEPEYAPEVLSASRLIAERTVVNDIGELLSDAVSTETGMRLSIDDLYFGIRFTSTAAGQRMQELGGVVQCDSVNESTSTRANSWRWFWDYRMGNCVVRLGVGWIDAHGKTDMQRGFLQWNPNKAGHRAEIDLLLAKIGRFAKRVELTRYDLAIDIPRARDSCRMSKDGRGYDYCDHGNGITEYLGSRNKPGRVKLYDKTREAGLSEEWTRLELTCAGTWTADDVLAKLPRVYAWDDRGCDGDTRNWVRALGLALATLLDKVGGTIEPYLRLLGRGARGKVMEYLASPAVEVDRRAVELAIGVAHDWQDAFTAVCISAEQRGL